MRKILVCLLVFALFCGILVSGAAAEDDRCIYDDTVVLNTSSFAANISDFRGGGTHELYWNTPAGVLAAAGYSFDLWGSQKTPPTYTICNVTTPAGTFYPNVQTATENKAWRIYKNFSAGSATFDADISLADGDVVYIAYGNYPDPAADPAGVYLKASVSLSSGEKPWTVKVIHGTSGTELNASEFADAAAVFGVTVSEGDSVWTALPLQYLCGLADDENPDSFNFDLAKSDYTITVTADDGFSTNFRSTAVAADRSVSLAYLLNGSVLPETIDGENGPKPCFPLQMVGVTNNQRIGGVTTIELSNVEDIACTLDGAMLWSLTPAQLTSLDTGSGIPLAGLIGLCDDRETAGPSGYTLNRSLVSAGYEVLVSGSMGTKTISSADLDRYTLLTSGDELSLDGAPEIGVPEGIRLSGTPFTFGDWNVSVNGPTFGIRFTADEVAALVEAAPQEYMIEGKGAGDYRGVLLTSLLGYVDGDVYDGTGLFDADRAAAGYTVAVAAADGKQSTFDGKSVAADPAGYILATSVNGTGLGEYAPLRIVGRGVAQGPDMVGQIVSVSIQGVAGAAPSIDGSGSAPEKAAAEAGFFRAVWVSETDVTIPASAAGTAVTVPGNSVAAMLFTTFENLTFFQNSNNLNIGTLNGLDGKNAIVRVDGEVTYGVAASEGKQFKQYQNILVSDGQLVNVTFPDEGVTLLMTATADPRYIFNGTVVVNSSVYTDGTDVYTGDIPWNSAAGVLKAGGFTYTLHSKSTAVDELSFKHITDQQTGRYYPNTYWAPDFEDEYGYDMAWRVFGSLAAKPESLRPDAVLSDGDVVYVCYGENNPVLADSRNARYIIRATVVIDDSGAADVMCDTTVELAADTATVAGALNASGLVWAADASGALRTVGSYTGDWSVCVGTTQVPDVSAYVLSSGDIITGEFTQDGAVAAKFRIVAKTPVVSVFKGTVQIVPGDTQVSGLSGTLYTVSNDSLLGALRAAGLNVVADEKSWSSSGVLSLAGLDGYVSDAWSSWASHLADGTPVHDSNPVRAENTYVLRAGDVVSGVYTKNAFAAAAYEVTIRTVEDGVVTIFNNSVVSENLTVSSAVAGTGVSCVYGSDGNLSSLGGFANHAGASWSFELDGTPVLVTQNSLVLMPAGSVLTGLYGGDEAKFVVTAAAPLPVVSLFNGTVELTSAPRTVQTSINNVPGSREMSGLTALAALEEANITYVLAVKTGATADALLVDYVTTPAYQNFTYLKHVRSWEMRLADGTVIDGWSDAAKAVNLYQLKDGDVLTGTYSEYGRPVAEFTIHISVKADAVSVTVPLTTGMVDVAGSVVEFGDPSVTSVPIPRNSPFGVLYTLYEQGDLSGLHFWGGKYTSFTNWTYLSLEDLNGLTHKASSGGVRYSWDGYLNGVKLDGDLHPAAGNLTGYGTLLSAGDELVFVYVPEGGDPGSAMQRITVVAGAARPEKILDDAVVTIRTENESVSFFEVLDAAGYTYEHLNGVYYDSYKDREYLEQVTINGTSYPAVVNTTDAFEWKITDGLSTSANLYKRGLNAYVSRSQSGQTFYLWYGNTTAARPDGFTYDFSEEYATYLVNLTVNILDPAVPTPTPTQGSGDDGPVVLYTRTLKIVNGTNVTAKISPVSGGYKPGEDTIEFSAATVAGLLEAAGLEYDVWKSQKTTPTYSLANITINGTLYANIQVGGDKCWRSFDGMTASAKKYDADTVLADGTTIYTVYGDYDTVNSDPSGAEFVIVTTIDIVSSDSPVLPRYGPFVTTAGGSDVTIRYKLSEEAAGAVEFRPAAGGDWTRIESPSSLLHVVPLTGLAASADYQYRVLVNGSWTETYSFRTLGDTDYTYVITSDSDPDGGSAADRHAYVAEAILAEKPLFVVHLGDFVGGGTSEAEWDDLFAVSRDMYANTIIFPVLGNHDDNSTLFHEMFGMPNWYSVDAGKLHLTVLDTNTWSATSFPVQSAWLEADLAGAAGQVKTVYFHHPIYTSDRVRERSNAEYNWSVMFGESGVDSAFSGHFHAYERLNLNGTRYVTAGIGGSDLSATTADPLPAYYEAGLYFKLGYLRGTVSGDSVLWEMVKVADVAEDNSAITQLYAVPVVCDRYSSGTALPTPTPTVTPVPTSTSGGGSDDTAPAGVAFTQTTEGSIWQTGESVPLTATVTAGTNVVYTWDMGNGDVVPGSAANYTYTTPGKYTVTVTASNGAGSESATAAIVVYDPANPSAVDLPYQILVYETVDVVRDANIPAKISPQSGGYVAGEDYYSIPTASVGGMLDALGILYDVWKPQVITIGKKEYSLTNLTIDGTLYRNGVMEGTDMSWRSYEGMVQGAQIRDANVLLADGTKMYTVYAPHETGADRKDPSVAKYVVVTTLHIVDSTEEVAPENAAIHAPTRPEQFAGSTIDFRGTATGTNLSYVWDFGDGTTAPGMSAVHVYENPGKYPVRFTASNSLGSSSAMYDVVVTEYPAADNRTLPRFGPFVLSVGGSDVTIRYVLADAAPGAVEFRPAAGGDWTRISSALNTTHALPLTGLSSATKYEYRVLVADGNWTDVFSFTTLGAESFTYVIVGDTAPTYPYYAYERSVYVADAVAAEKPLFIVNTGDFTGSGDVAAEWEDILSVSRDMYANAVLFTIRGNHETDADIYSELFGMPMWYSADAGPLHMVFLDTNTWGREEFVNQTAWLRADLAATDAAVKTVYFHHPFYTSDRETHSNWGLNATEQAEWESIFAEYNVSAAFSGHFHAYERYLVNNTVYVTAGLGGSNQFDAAGEPEAELLKGVYHTLGYLRPTVSGGNFSWDMVKAADFAADNSAVTLTYPAGVVIKDTYPASAVPHVLVNTTVLVDPAATVVAPISLSSGGYVPGENFVTVSGNTGAGVLEKLGFVYDVWKPQVIIPGKEYSLVNVTVNGRFYPNLQTVTEDSCWTMFTEYVPGATKYDANVALTDGTTVYFAYGDYATVRNGKELTGDPTKADYLLVVNLEFEKKTLFAGPISLLNASANRTVAAAVAAAGLPVTLNGTMISDISGYTAADSASWAFSVNGNTVSESVLLEDGDVLTGRFTSAQGRTTAEVVITVYLTEPPKEVSGSGELGMKTTVSDDGNSTVEIDPTKLKNETGTAAEIPGTGWDFCLVVFDEKQSSGGAVILVNPVYQLQMNVSDSINVSVDAMDLPKISFETGVNVSTDAVREIVENAYKKPLSMLTAVKDVSTDGNISRVSIEVFVPKSMNIDPSKVKMLRVKDNGSPEFCSLTYTVKDDGYLFRGAGDGFSSYVLYEDSTPVSTSSDSGGDDGYTPEPVKTKEPVVDRNVTVEHVSPVSTPDEPSAVSPSVTMTPVSSPTATPVPEATRTPVPVCAGILAAVLGIFAGRRFL